MSGQGVHERLTEELAECSASEVKPLLEHYGLEGWERVVLGYDLATGAWVISATAVGKELVEALRTVAQGVVEADPEAEIEAEIEASIREALESGGEA